MSRNDKVAEELTNSSSSTISLNKRLNENCEQIKAFLRETPCGHKDESEKETWTVNMKSLFHLYFIHCALVVEADKTVVYVVAITKFV